MRRTGSHCRSCHVIATLDSLLYVRYDSGLTREITNNAAKQARTDDGPPMRAQGRAVRGRDARVAFRDDDHEQRRQAERIGEVFPFWLIMWGAYSRQFWAYPRFGAPHGTIAHAADPNDLAASMRAIESAAHGGRRRST